MRSSRGLLGGVVGIVAAVTLAVAPTTAFAAGHGGGGGGGRGGGGGGGETTTANNLSVPTIMVAGGFTGVTCPSGTPGALVAPSGTPSTGYPLDTTAFYYVQGINTWQAQCYTASTASATAAWGDNLTGDAKLSVGSPIRVELGLLNSDTAAPSMDGYSVVKLDPNALDRESAYGTLATGSTATGFTARPTTFAAADQRVYDGGVTFGIKNDTTGAYVVALGTKASAEINATGNVVYGYNLRVTSAGSYTITYTVPTVTLTGSDGGTFNAHTVSLTITVATGGGGGGGHGHR